MGTPSKSRGGDLIAPYGTMPTIMHQFYLSEKGRLLVEAWLAGDEAKYREMLAKKD